MQSRTVRELRELAREMQITGRSKMRKIELLAAIEAVLTTHTTTETSVGSSPTCLHGSSVLVASHDLQPRILA